MTFGSGLFKLEPGLYSAVDVGKKASNGLGIVLAWGFAGQCLRIGRVWRVSRSVCYWIVLVQWGSRGSVVRGFRTLGLRSWG